MRPSVLLVMFGSRLAMGQQQVFQGPAFGEIGPDPDGTQLYHSGLYDEGLQKYNDVPTDKAQGSHPCPFGQYFNGERCVRNQQGHPCIPGWVYDPLAGECQHRGGTPPLPSPSDCEAERKKCETRLSQCRNENELLSNQKQQTEQKLATCERERDDCRKQPLLPSKPGKYVPDPSGIYKCSFVPHGGGGGGEPCKGRLRTSPATGTVFYQYFSRNDGRTFPNPWVTIINGPAVLEIVDQWCRVAQYEIKVDGQSLGRTSDVDFQNNCWAVSCGANRDQCVSKGYSHGLFEIPSGMNHRVEVFWAEGKLTNAWGGLWTHNQGLYRVWDACS